MAKTVWYHQVTQVAPGVHYKLTKDVHTLAVLSERISQI